MSKLIALYGRPQSGKTPTLKLLKRVILEKFNVQPNQIKELGKEKYGNGRNDICVILNGITKINIGVFSEGDYPENITKYIGELLLQNCEIIFCACRTWGKTKRAVNEVGDKHQVQFVRKIICKDLSKQEEINKKQANNLIALAGF